LAYDKYNGDSYYFVKQQFFRGIMVGAVLFFLIARIRFERWKKYGIGWLLATIILLILVFIPSIAHVEKARSWINIAGITIQTSELAKLTFIFYLAIWLESHKMVLDNFKRSIIPFTFVLGLVCLLLMLQPDMGTMMVYLGFSLVMYFVAGMKWRHLLIAIILGSVLVAGLIVVAPYRFERLTTFLHPSSDVLDGGYQLNQSLIATGSGGWFGLGLGQSRQKFGTLPKVESDSIFAIIAEEWGFILSSLMVLLYWGIFIRGMRIAKNSPDLFAKLLATGIVSWITLQTLMNMAAIIGLMPLTGLPLPFVSLGGSNLVIAIVAMALLLNISKFTKPADE